MGGALPGCGGALVKRVAARFARRTAEHVDIVAHAPQRSQQALAIRSFGKPGSSLVGGLLHEGSEADEAFAGVRRRGGNDFLASGPPGRKRQQLLGHEADDPVGRLDDRSRRPRGYDKDRDQQPDPASQSDPEDSIGGKVHGAPVQSGSAQENDGGRDGSDPEARGTRGQNREGASAIARAAALESASSGRIARATAMA